MAFAVTPKFKYLAKYNTDRNKLRHKTVLKMIDKFIYTNYMSLMLDTIANLLITTFLTFLLMAYISEMWITIITVMLSFVMLFLFEALPKTIAKRHSCAWIHKLWWVCYGCWLVCFPITWLMNKMFGKKEDKSSLTFNEMEMDYMLQQGQSEHIIEVEEYFLAHNALRFDEKNVSVIVTPNVAFVQKQWDKKQLLNYMHTQDYSRLPVMENNVYIGYICTRQVYKLFEEDKNNWQSLINPINRVVETEKISVVLNKMKKWKDHICLVENNKQAVIGIVTMEAVLETLVGQIEDETD